jgi:hypothetical protein
MGQDWTSSSRYRVAEQLASFERMRERLIHNPLSLRLEKLLPSHWIKTHLTASQTIDSRLE